MSSSVSMKASQKYWDMIKEHEGDPRNRVSGVKQPVLVAYKDSVGVWTIGYGHTGSDIKQGVKITREKAIQYLRQDSTNAADCIRRLLKRWGSQGVPGSKLTQGQFDALVSLVFNSGCSGVLGSKFILKTKAGKHKEAANLIKSYKLNAGKHRREAESKLYLS